VSFWILPILLKDRNSQNYNQTPRNLKLRRARIPQKSKILDSRFTLTIIQTIRILQYENSRDKFDGVVKYIHKKLLRAKNFQTFLG